MRVEGGFVDVKPRPYALNMPGRIDSSSDPQADRLPVHGSAGVRSSTSVNPKPPRIRREAPGSVSPPLNTFCRPSSTRRTLTPRRPRTVATTAPAGPAPSTSASGPTTVRPHLPLPDDHRWSALSDGHRDPARRWKRRCRYPRADQRKRQAPSIPLELVRKLPHSCGMRHG